MNRKDKRASRRVLRCRVAKETGCKIEALANKLAAARRSLRALSS